MNSEDEASLLGLWWLRLTEPPTAIIDVGQRRDVRVLATLLLVLISLGFTSALIQALNAPRFMPRFVTILSALFVLGIAYRISRTVRYRVAAMIAALVPIFTGAAVGLAAPEDPAWFAFMMLGSVIASMLLTAWQVGVIGGLNTALTAVVLFRNGGFSADGQGVPVIAFTVITSMLVVVVTRHRALVAEARESDIRESQTLYRLLFERAPVGIAVITLDGGRLVTLNDAMLRPGGYDRADLERLVNVHQLFEDSAAWTAVLERLGRDGRVTASELRMRARDGSAYTVSMSLEPVSFAGQRCVVVITEDISARKRAEAVGSNLASIIEKSLNEVYIFDTDTLRFAYANEGARRNVGYSMDQLRTLTPLDLKPEFDAESFRALIDPLLHGETQQLVFETVHRRADGTRYPVEVRLQLAWSGGRLMFLALILDVTARKQVEQEKERLSKELHAQERRSGSLIEHSADMIMLVGADGNLLYLNPAFQTALGYRVEDWLGRSVFGLVAPEDQPQAAMLFAQSVAAISGVTGGLLRVLHADGSVRWLEGTATNHIADPATRGIVINCRDVTEHRQAEDILRENEQRLRVAIDTADLAVFEMDTDLRYTWMYNPHLGYAPDAQIGSTDHILLGEDGLNVMALKRRALESGQQLREEVRIKRAGKERTFMLTVEPRRSESGAVIGLRGASLDVSEEKALHARFLQAQKMETVGRLAGGIAHDFNNLLTVINGAADLSASTLSEGDPLLPDLAMIRRTGERGAALTRQLLAFSREQMLQPKVVNLNAVVADVATMLQRLIGEDVRLVMVPGDDLWTFRADVGQIEQAIVNLAVNARDAMPHGGTLTIETRNVVLEPEQAVQLSIRPGPYVLLSVRDDGAGMDDATRERVFDPFFTTKGIGTGTGLGLSTVHGIVIQSGGGITVSSQPGEGATFTLYLPTVGEEEAADLRPQRADVAGRGTGTILFVDDEEAIRKLAKRALSAEGYQVLTAESGTDALRLLEDYGGTVDLLISDVVMPEMRGPELAERLSKSRPEIAVLFTSGFLFDTVGALEETTRFLRKPYSIAELARKVREVLKDNDKNPMAR